MSPPPPVLLGSRGASTRVFRVVSSWLRGAAVDAWPDPQPATPIATATSVPHERRSFMREA